VKRDMDIIRELMLRLESRETAAELPDRPRALVAYNGQLMIEHGLAEGTIFHGSDGQIAVILRSLNLGGSRFLRCRA
jgi:hypothetical protein